MAQVRDLASFAARLDAPAGTPLPVAVFLEFALGLTSRLVQLHQTNALHGNLCPKCFEINAAGEVSWAHEFKTLAKADPSSTGPVPGDVLPYMSPEHTGRTHQPVDVRSDLYGLGVILYQLASGRLPFLATDALSWMHCHLARQPEPLGDDCLSEVPRAIIMKLLAKDPDERYQTARGLLHDLQVARRQFEVSGRIESFPLGRHETAGPLQIPRKLYGREAATAQYLKSFERVEGGAREVVLIAGYSGIGKSSLVYEIHSVLTEEQGYFCAGKFDQQKRGIPYSAFLRAFGGLLQLALSESEGNIAETAAALRREVGHNALFLGRLLPDLKLFFGPEVTWKSSDSLNPSEVQHRLLLAFRGLLRAFSMRGRPVCVFVDDLQWADAGSLWLFEGLVTAESLGPVLIVGAYRDNEVDNTHPLHMTLTSMRAKQVAINLIELANLTLAPARQLIADTLGRTPEEVAPLAHLVLRKTRGNPFFVRQFLRALHEDGYLKRSAEDGKYCWDLQAIEARSFTDNVVELMSVRVSGLSPDTREAVKLAACIGNTFDLESLSAIAGIEPVTLAQRLVPALEQEYILGELGEISDSIAERAAKIRLRFMHDRVQQAAYELIGAEQRPALHLQIGRRLLALEAHKANTERIFEIAGHFEHSADLLDEPVERLRVAELHLSAALLAKQSTAYSAARRYLQAAALLLPPRADERHHAIFFGVLRQRAEVEYLLGAADEAEILLDEALVAAQTVLERVDLLKLRSVICAMKMRWIEAVDAGCEALAAAGVGFPPRQTPDKELDRYIAEETAEINRQLAGRSVLSLVDAPECADETHRRVIGIFSSLVVTLYVARLHKLNLLACSIMTRLSLERGLAPDGYPFGMYGTMITHFGDARRGYDFSLLGVELSRRFGRQADICRGSFNLAVNVQHWVKPLADGDAVLRDGYRAALDGGEIQFGGYILIYLVLNPLFRGANVHVLVDEVPGYLAFARRKSHTLALDCLHGQLLILRELLGRADVLPDEHVEEVAYLEHCQGEVLKYALCVYMICKTMTAYLHREPTPAMGYAAIAYSTLDTIPGKFQAAALVYYEMLSMAMMSASEPGGTLRNAEFWRLGHAKLVASSDRCPENFAHKRAHVEAEIARLRGQYDSAAALYDDAIRLAREHGFVNVEAMAAESAGRFWLERGRGRIGLDYLNDAVAAYRSWGTDHKVKLLLLEFPGLDTRIQKPRSLRPDAFDIEAVFKAARVLSRQLVLTRLLEQMVEVLMENAGAEFGTLLLARDGEWAIVARGDAHARHYEATTSRILAEHEQEVCATAIRLVARTETTVLSADAMLDPVLRKDPYVARRGVRSLLCAPITYAGRLLGIVQLENNALPGLFGSERVEIVQLLAAQAAVSLENSLVYEDLEKLVEDRTQKLRAAQEKLVEAARLAGRADIAGGAIHNVGNALNSVAVIRADIHQRTSALRTDRLQQLYEMLEKNQSALGPFLESDPKGRRVIPYLKELANRFATDRLALLEEITELGNVVERIQEIVRSQLQDSGAPLILERVNIAKIVQNALDVGVSSVDRRRLDIEVVVDVPEDLEVETDRYRLLQILTNLMTNARKAVRLGTAPQRCVQVTGRQVEKGGVILTVEDNGIGMDADHQKRLFQQGFTTWGDGTGIGLHSSALEARHIGATLSATSEGVGRGARFTIEIPPTPPRPNRWEKRSETGRIVQGGSL